MRSFRFRLLKTQGPPAVIALLAFALAVSEPAGTAAEIRQWAREARASSEYSAGDWSARQATGAPDTFQNGDIRTAWAPAHKDGTTEWLELTYEQAVVPRAIGIRETFNPGFVTKVEAYNPIAGQWVVLWQGKDPTRESPGVFSPPLSPVTFSTNRIRITIDTNVPGWNEIDAVELVGLRGEQLGGVVTGPSPASNRFTLKVSPLVVEPGGTVTVTYTASSDWDPTAWIGIIPAGTPRGSQRAADDVDIAYKYLNRSAYGTLTFTMPTTPGVYEFRMFPSDNDTFPEVAVSEPVTVASAVSGPPAPGIAGAPGSSPQLTGLGPQPASRMPRLILEPSVARPGQTLTLTFEGAPGYPQDWVTLVSTSTPAEQYGEWYYLGGKRAGTVSFKAPDAPGTYEVRLYENWPAGGYKIVARSNTITVGTSPQSSAPGAGTSIGTATGDWGQSTSSRPAVIVGVSARVTGGASSVPGPIGYPRTGMLYLQVRIDSPGTILDTIGLNAAPIGSFALIALSDGRIEWRVYDPQRQTRGRDPNGWHVVRSDPAPFGVWHDIQVQYGAGGTALIVDGMVYSLPELVTTLSGQQVYIGDFPGDSRWEPRYNSKLGFAGEVKGLRFE